MEQEELINLNFEDVLDWTFPRRCQSPSGDFITFKAKDPKTGKLREKRYWLEKFKAGVERDTMAAQMIANLLRNLQQNWNPFVPNLEDRSGTLLSEVVDDFKKTINAEVSKHIKTVKTRNDYFSRLSLFFNWADKNRVSVISQCTPAVVDSYLQWCLVNKGNSAQTRNNNRTFLSAFFGWCIKRHYLKSNPCAEIENVRVNGKRRKPLSPLDMERVRCYLLDHDKHFLLAVMMQYYTFIRPKELSHIRLRDISVMNQTVIVPAMYSKNHREEPVALNDNILKLMVELEIFKFPNDFYLFGKGFIPSAVRADERIFREKWSEIRDELGFSYSKKFYSLKDTGIIDLIAAEGAVNARDQARHSSIAVTNQYARGGGKHVHEETKHFKGKL